MYWHAKSMWNIIPPLAHVWHRFTTVILVHMQSPYAYKCIGATKGNRVVLGSIQYQPFELTSFFVYQTRLLLYLPLKNRALSDSQYPLPIHMMSLENAL